MNETPPFFERLKTFLWWALGLTMFAAIAVAFALSSSFTPTETLIVVIVLVLLFGNRMPPGARGGIHDRFDRR